MIIGQVRGLIESISGALQIAGHLLFHPLLRGWRRGWGTTEEERTLRLPGDELVPEPQWAYNHAVSIGAPRSAVWPWLVQLGQGRGGFYSYEGLENLVGCQIRNVFELRQELQQLHVGDRIVLHGRSGFGPEVVRLEPERVLVLGGPPNEKGSQATWAFPPARRPQRDDAIARARPRCRRDGPGREGRFRPLLDGPDRFRDEQEDAPNDQGARRSRLTLSRTAGVADCDNVGACPRVTRRSRCSTAPPIPS
jgi:hypothetical protein